MWYRFKGDFERFYVYDFPTVLSVVNLAFRFYLCIPLTSLLSAFRYKICVKMLGVNMVNLTLIAYNRIS